MGTLPYVCSPSLRESTIYCYVVQGRLSVTLKHDSRSLCPVREGRGLRHETPMVSESLTVSTGQEV